MTCCERGSEAYNGRHVAASTPGIFGPEKVRPFRVMNGSETERTDGSTFIVGEEITKP